MTPSELDALAAEAWHETLASSRALVQTGAFRDLHKVARAVYAQTESYVRSRLDHPDLYNVRVSLGDNGPLGVHISERSAVERLGDIE